MRSENVLLAAAAKGAALDMPVALNWPTANTEASDPADPVPNDIERGRGHGAWAWALLALSGSDQGAGRLHEASACMGVHGLAGAPMGFPRQPMGFPLLG